MQEGTHNAYVSFCFNGPSTVIQFFFHFPIVRHPPPRISPHFPPFFPIFLHFPPFFSISPISPHFPPYFHFPQFSEPLRPVGQFGCG